MDRFNIEYSYKTYCETEWFKSENKKAAIKHLRDIVGSDIKIEYVVVRGEFNAKKCISKKL